MVAREKQRERENEIKAKSEREGESKLEKQKGREIGERERGGDRIESAAQKPRQHRRGLIDLTYFSEGRPHEVGDGAVVRGHSTATTTTTPSSLAS